MNRPDFGSGLLQLVFAPEQRRARRGDAVPGAGRAAAVARRPDRASRRVEVEAIDSTLRVTVRYVDPPHAGAAGGARSSAAEAARDLPLLRRAAPAARSPAHPTLNGIDYLEVLDDDAPRRQPAPAHAARPLAASRCRRRSPPSNVRIEGGERDRDIRVEWVAAATALPPAATAAEQALSRRCRTRPRARRAHRPPATSRTYTLRLVRSAIDPTPPAGLRPAPRRGRRSRSRSTARATSTARRSRSARPSRRAAPEIDYLAKDYASFRRADARPPGPARAGLAGAQPGRPRRGAGRAARLRRRPAELPAGRGRHRGLPRHRAAPHRRCGATPGWSTTAMHDGCNARAWLHVAARRADGRRCRAPAPASTPASPRCPTASSRTRSRTATRCAPARSVFEPLARRRRSTPRTTRSPFYTWGDRRCCLPARRDARRRSPAHLARPRGGRRAALRGGARAAHRRAGRRRPGAPPRRAPHATCRGVRRPIDPDRGRVTDPLTDRPDHRDRLGRRRTRCRSRSASRPSTDEAHGEDFVDDVSVARGNIVLADHGVHARRRRAARHRAGRRRCSSRRTATRRRCERARSARDPAALPPGARRRAADLRGHRRPRRSPRAAPP